MAKHNPRFKYNQKGYTHYVVDTRTGKIATGWYYNEDAKEARQDLVTDFPGVKTALKVYTKQALVRQGVSPDDNANWADIPEVAALISKRNPAPKKMLLWYRQTDFGDLYPIGYFTTRAGAIKKFSEELKLYGTTFKQWEKENKAHILVAYDTQPSGTGTGALVVGPRSWLGHKPNPSARMVGLQRNPKAPKAGWALLRSQGMKEVVVSVHKTKEAAEEAMIKRGGIPNSQFTMGLGVREFGPGTSYEFVDSEYTGKFLRPVLPKRNPSARMVGLQRNGKKKVSKAQASLFDQPERYTTSECATTLIGSRWWVPPPARTKVVRCASQLAHHRWKTPMRNPAAAPRITKMRKIVAEHQAAKVDGRKIDAFTASAYVAVHDRLNADNKAKLEAMPIAQAIGAVYKLLG
jgi:hypothetical protein